MKATRKAVFPAAIILAIADFISFSAGIFLSVGLVYVLWGDLDSYMPGNEMESRFGAHLLLSLVCVVWFHVRLHHYTYRKPFWFELKETLRTIAIFAVIDLAIVAFSKWHLSRYIWVFTWSFVLVLLPLMRFSVKKILYKFGLWQKQSVIIGIGKNARDAYLAVKSEKDLGFDVQFFFTNDKHHPDSIFNVPVINDEALLWASVDPRHSQFFVAVEYEEEAQRELWIKNLTVRNCRSVSVIPTTRGIPLNSTDMSFIFSHEVLILRINNNLTKFTARAQKRAFDLLGSLIIAILLSPLLVALALLIARDGGSPLYCHERVGRNGRRFKCLKFRSMVTNADEALTTLLAANPQAKAEWEQDFKLKDDPRNTPIGAFLRKTSLDELPQLWNVLKGEMSLVGPRPVIDKELERYAENVDYYLLANPGMTGLWQVSGRNDMDYETRVYFDAWYVKNWSLWNDIAILFKTINVVVKRKGAY